MSILCLRELKFIAERGKNYKYSSRYFKTFLTENESIMQATILYCVTVGSELELQKIFAFHMSLFCYL